VGLFPSYIAYEGGQQPVVASAGFLASLTNLFGGVLSPPYGTYAAPTKPAELGTGSSKK
jgi:hypothetical protein